MSVRSAERQSVAKARALVPQIVATCAVLADHEAYIISPTLDGDLVGWVTDADHGRTVDRAYWMVFPAGAGARTVRDVIDFFVKCNGL